MRGDQREAPQSSEEIKEEPQETKDENREQRLLRSSSSEQVKGQRTALGQERAEPVRQVRVRVRLSAPPRSL